MSRFLALGLFAAALAVFPPDARAQKTNPRISVAQPSANLLLKDLEYLIGLSNNSAQWEVVEDYMDSVFLVGIDRTKPIRFDLVITDDGGSYRPVFPVSDMKEFRNNLNGFGITARLRSRSRTLGDLYSVKENRVQNGFDGWLRYKEGYAHVGQRAGDVLRVSDPTVEIASLLTKGYSVAGQLVNQPEGIQDRYASFKTVQANLLAKLKKGKEETDEEFALRKLMSENRLEEMARYFAESQEVTVGWLTSSDKTSGLDLDLVALPNSSLEKSIEKQGLAPSHFANVPQNPDAVLSLHTNYALDDFQQKHLVKFIDSVHARFNKHIDSSDERNAEQKAAARKAGDIAVEMLKEGNASGLLNLFIDIEKSGDKHYFIGAVKTPDGTKGTEFVQLLPKTLDGVKLTEKVAEVEGVAIHQVTLPDQGLLLPVFRDFLGDETVAYLGVSKDTLWIGSGVGSLEKLKEAITKVAKPNTGKASDPIVSVIAKAGPWIERRNRRGVETKYPEHRKMALEAFAKGEDTVILKLSRVEKKIVGRVDVQTGILRFIGSMMAQFSKENLDE